MVILILARFDGILDHCSDRNYILHLHEIYLSVRYKNLRSVTSMFDTLKLYFVALQIVL
jgi:hypothetical protein